MTKRLIQLIDEDGDNVGLFACDHNSTTDDQIKTALEECVELNDSDFECEESVAILEPLGIERVYIDLEVNL